LVECNLAKVDVEGSNPFARSGNFDSATSSASAISISCEVPLSAVVVRECCPALCRPDPSKRLVGDFFTS
jgi:hypothetical protein